VVHHFGKIKFSPPVLAELADSATIL